MVELGGIGAKLFRLQTHNIERCRLDLGQYWVALREGARPSFRNAHFAQRSVVAHSCPPPSPGTSASALPADAQGFVPRRRPDPAAISAGASACRATTVGPAGHAGAHARRGARHEPRRHVRGSHALSLAQRAPHATHALAGRAPTATAVAPVTPRPSLGRPRSGGDGGLAQAPGAGGHPGGGRGMWMRGA